MRGNYFESFQADGVFEGDILMKKHFRLFAAIITAISLSSISSMAVSCDLKNEHDNINLSGEIANPYIRPSYTDFMRMMPLLFVKENTLYYKMNDKSPVKISANFTKDNYLPKHSVYSAARSQPMGFTAFISPDNRRFAYFKEDLDFLPDDKRIEDSNYYKDFGISTLFYYDTVTSKERKVSEYIVIEKYGASHVNFDSKGNLYYTAYDPFTKDINLYVFNGVKSKLLKRSVFWFSLSDDYKKISYRCYSPGVPFFIDWNGDPRKYPEDLYVYYTNEKRTVLIDRAIIVIHADRMNFCYFFYEKETKAGKESYIWENGTRSRIRESGQIDYDRYKREYYDYNCYFYSVKEKEKQYELHSVENSKDSIVATEVIRHTLDNPTGNLLYITRSGYFVKLLHKKAVLLTDYSMSSDKSNNPTKIEKMQLEFYTRDWKIFFCRDYSATKSTLSDLFTFQLAGDKVINKVLIDKNVYSVQTYDGLNGAIYFKNSEEGKKEICIAYNNADGTFKEKSSVSKFDRLSYIYVYYYDKKFYINYRPYGSQTDTCSELYDPAFDFLIYENGEVKTLLKSVNNIILRNGMMYLVQKEENKTKINEIGKKGTTQFDNIQIILEVVCIRR
jgi:hypothetical protein